MSLDYDLRIATNLQPKQTLELLAKQLNFEWEKNQTLYSPGIVISAIAENENRQTFMQSLFGFTPTVNIWFWLDSNQDYEQGKHSLLLATTTLLNSLPGDAVLLFNGESIVLEKIAGALIFNKDLATWSETQLAEIQQPFYIESLPSPLLSHEPPSLNISNATHTRLKSIAIRQGISLTELANQAIEAYINTQIAELSQN
ncbi:SitI3 family protein [Ancylothrix sp. C2]|uniref:SitI3 family protein n=1 Tax=Ancylothrix sp. D3o TaxID=2953691 RepID=UPI0021BAEDE2|nr:SitI3 family protein [Ancylothrix sp. D3o]MCT7952665.1 SitI3 family protein [Ancylothrix sp. D3o]